MQSINHNLSHVYQSVEVNENDGLLNNSDTIGYSVGENDNLKNTVKYAPWIITAIVVSFLILNFMFSATAAPANFRASHVDVVGCKPCTYSQCQLTGCGSTAPFMCTAGGANNGCASDAMDWLKSISCSDCCDSSNCPSVLSSGKECEVCTFQQCAELAAVSNQKCGSSAPYVCAYGSARMGCSSDAKSWLSMSPATCRYDRSFDSFYSFIINSSD